MLLDQDLPANRSRAVASERSSGSRRGSRPKQAFEALAVLLAPLFSFYALRLRAMSPVQLPDPSMHTTFILQARDIFLRYTAAFTPTARLREGARVGFLVPARLAYLAFGAVPGFFVTRYVFALIATVPVYLLFRRIYGRAAGALGVAIILTCPVIITAWGTDYPDSAVVSYMAGALSCLALASGSRVRRRWLVAASVLLTLAVWAHGIGALLAVTTIACYAFVQLVRERRTLFADLFVMAASFVGMTAILVVASGVLLGQYNFIGPTWAAFRYLSQPSEVNQWHSESWRWAPYYDYVFVPPAAFLALGISVAGRLRALSTPKLFLLVVSAVQLVVFFYEQFVGHVQTLEMHYFSSALWASVCIVLALAIAELATSLFASPWMSWLPAVTVIAVAFAYETDPHVPAFGWFPWGEIVAAIVVVSAFCARGLGGGAATVVRVGSCLVALVVMIGSLLVLTTAPDPAHRPLPHTVPDPAPAYATALGGSATDSVDFYRLSAQLPTFVGPASYPGEQLLMWLPLKETGPLIELMGIYHAGFDQIAESPPTLSAVGRQRISARRPGEILILSLQPRTADGALAALSRYEPTMLRHSVLEAGTFRVYVWLIQLGTFANPGLHAVA